MTWDDEARARVAGMKRAGMTNKQIAERLGTTPGMVSNVASKAKAYCKLVHRTGKARNSAGRLALARWHACAIEELT